MQTRRQRRHQRLLGEYTSRGQVSGQLFTNQQLQRVARLGERALAEQLYAELQAFYGVDPTAW